MLGDILEVFQVGFCRQIYQTDELVVLRVDDVATVLFIIKFLHYVWEDDLGQHGPLVRKALGENFIVPVLDAEENHGEAVGNQGLPNVGKDAFQGSLGRDRAVYQVQDAVEPPDLLDFREVGKILLLFGDGVFHDGFDVVEFAVHLGLLGAAQEGGTFHQLAHGTVVIAAQQEGQQHAEQADDDDVKGGVQGKVGQGLLHGLNGDQGNVPAGCYRGGLAKSNEDAAIQGDALDAVLEGKAGDVHIGKKGRPQENIAVKIRDQNVSAGVLLQVGDLLLEGAGVQDADHGVGFGCKNKRFQCQGLPVQVHLQRGEGVETLGLEQSLVIHLSNIIGTKIIADRKDRVAPGYHFLIIWKVNEHIPQAVAGHHPQALADLIAGVARG